MTLPQIMEESVVRQCAGASLWTVKGHASVYRLLALRLCRNASRQQAGPTGKAPLADNIQPDQSPCRSR